MGEANKELNISQLGANNGQLGDLNPFWVGTRLLCVETLVEFSCEISCNLEFDLFWTIRAIYGLV